MALLAGTTTQTRGLDHRSTPVRPRGRRVTIGWVVGGSLATGLLAAVGAVLAPVTPTDDVAMTGGVLAGFALGWALLAVLAARLSDQPQWWAAGPAIFLAGGGVLLLARPSGDVLDVLAWVWPPALLGLAGVITLGARRRLRSRTRRWLLSPLVALTILTAAAGGYETVQEAADPAQPRTGRLIEVGDHRLYLRCTGTGTPTVVLEPGLGEASPVMGWVAPAVAADTRVCVYDRAGRGWSDPAAGPMDGVRTAADLHTLLQGGQVDGPYVLAGHSFGGLYALAFAAAYPDEVAGLVLIDSTAPAPAPAATPAPPPGNPPATRSSDPTNRLFAMLPATAQLGVARLWARFSYDTLPAPSKDEALVRAARASQVRSLVDELGQGSAAVQQAAAVRDLQRRPLIVLTAGRGHDASWRADQDRLATLSTNSRHRVVTRATHTSLLLDPTDAAATSRAVLDVVASVRSEHPRQRPGATS